MHAVIRIPTHPPVILDAEASIKPGECPEEGFLSQPHASRAGLDSTKDVLARHIIALFTQSECYEHNDEGDEEPKEPEL